MRISDWSSDVCSSDLQTALQILQQTFALLAFVGKLSLVTPQAGTFGLQCRTDALVNGSFTLPQSHVLAALRLVIGLRGLQLGAHLLDLSPERCHGIGWGVTFDTQRQHLCGR